MRSTSCTLLCPTNTRLAISWPEWHFNVASQSQGRLYLLWKSDFCQIVVTTFHERRVKTKKNNFKHNGPMPIRQSSNKLPPSPVILWIKLGGRPKWLPLNFGYNDAEMCMLPFMWVLLTTEQRCFVSSDWMAPFLKNDLSSTCFEPTENPQIQRHPWMLRDSVHPKHIQSSSGKNWSCRRQRNIFLHHARPINSFPGWETIVSQPP